MRPGNQPSNPLRYGRRRHLLRQQSAGAHASSNPIHFMRTRALLSLAFVSMLAAPLSAQYVMVGGESMYPTKDIVSNAVNSKDHTTLVAAVKAAGLVSTLQGKGPFTVFAPINGAFAVLPASSKPSTSGASA